MNYNIHCIKRKRIDLMIEGDSEKKKNTPRCGHTLLPGLQVICCKTCHKSVNFTTTNLDHLFYYFTLDNPK